MTSLSPAVVDGIRKFIRLTALRSNPLEIKWVQDEFDVIDALEVVKQKFHETSAMVGKKMYKGQTFDPVEDVKGELEEYLLTGREAIDTALARKRNLMMYHLVIEPVIEMFKDVEHEHAIKTVDRKVQEAIKLVETIDVPSHYDDAIVAREQVRNMIHEREARRKIELAKKRRAKRRKKKDSDLEKLVEA